MQFPNYQLQKVLKSLRYSGFKDRALSKMGPALHWVDDEEEIFKGTCLISSNSV